MGEVRKLKFWSKPQALELLGKHIGMLRDGTDERLLGAGGVQIVIHTDGNGLTGAQQDAARFATIDGRCRDDAKAALLPAGESG